MSRCFSFPPPNYVWNGISGDALIDLIKNLGEKKKNENDERRKKRKRDEKAKKKSEQYKKKIQKHNETSDDTKEKSEDVEKSDLTEEKSIGSLCYTSDGTTQSSSRSKRKTDDDELPCNENHSDVRSALILLFKECFWFSLYCYYHSISESSLTQYKETNATVLSKAHPCTEAETSELSEQKHRCSKMAQEEGMYRRALIENLDVIPLQYEAVCNEDTKWLYERKYQDDDAAKRLKTTSNNCSFGYSLSEGPRAQYIEEADIYALPYTIPF